MSSSGYGYNNQADNAPLMSNGGYGPQGSYPPSGGYGHPGGPPGNPPQGGQYPPPGSQYDAPPTNYQQPYQDNSSYASQTNNTFASMAAGGNMNDVFFAAAVSIMVCGLCSGMVYLFSLRMFDFLALTYLTTFGAVLGVLDTPFFKTIKFVVESKTYIGKYVQFVTRVTGKGVAFIFLASMLFMTVWENCDHLFFQFMVVLLCLFPAVVGGFAIGIGVLKSNKLDKARRQLQLYNWPNGGLTMSEFNVLTMENGGFKFQSLDLKLIFNALVSNPSWRVQASAAQTQQGGYSNAEEVRIPKQDLLDWTNGGFVFL